MTLLGKLNSSERRFLACALMTGADAAGFDDRTVDSMLLKASRGSPAEDYSPEEAACLVAAFEAGLAAAHDGGRDPDLDEFMPLAARVEGLKAAFGHARGP